MRALAYTPFTPAELRPEGWLRRQLRIQADGLAGHLHEVWPDVRDSQWIGGNREGWERVPYWLDGLIPLAWLLEDDNLQAVCHRYVEAILAGQEEDGWICPCPEEERAHYDMWALFLIGKVLVVYHDCTGDQRIPGVLYRAMRQFYDHNREHTLFDWGHARWFEALITLSWLRERFDEPWLEELGRRMYQQGLDYAHDLEQRYEADPADWSYYNHVVNIAMSLKAEAEYARFIDAPITGLAERALTSLLRRHSTPTDHFTGDECLHGDSPVSGTELCGVVEAMYSYERLLSITGDPAWGDRLERLAFNALPAAMSPDMWSHQYDQMANQMQCTPIPEGQQPFRTNNGEAHLFGLEPHFGCCTSNFGQGWPKFALSAFMRRPDGGIASTALVPSRLTTQVNGTEVTCALETLYPFEDTLQYTLRVARPVEFTLAVRIPGCVKAATVDGQPATPGSFYEITRTFEGETTITVTLTPEVTYTPRPLGNACLNRGVLLYSLPIKARWEKWEYEKDGVERRYPYCDWLLHPESDWAFAFAPGKVTAASRQGNGDLFSPEGAPCALRVPVVPIAWEQTNGVCAPAPANATPRGDVQWVEFIPYGCTNLRMTELPAPPAE